MPHLYVHIPFCKTRCIYCDFYSTTLSGEWQEPYVEAIGRELASRPDRAFTTLYLGGGTPSQLAPASLHRLFEVLGRYATLAHDAEVTIEVNPDDVTPQWVEAIRQTPVNRVSMGVQSFDGQILHTLRRRHTADQARKAVSMLREAGYENISLDLIYGLPGQSLRQFTADVEEVGRLGIPHLSAYALQFEEGTPLTAMRQEGSIHEADEELSLACYESLMDVTARYGLQHYEVSNFARPGFRSRHNSSYWTGEPYVGLGAGAHSYDGKRTRSSNLCDIRRYIDYLKEGKLPSVTETLSDEDLYNERVMLSLRTCEGLSLPRLEHDFGRKQRLYCERMAAPHVERGTIRRTPDEALCLTRRGLFVSDDIISDLLLV